MAMIRFLLVLMLLLAPAADAAEPYPSIAMFEWQQDNMVESSFRSGIQKAFPEARFYVYNAAENPQLLDRLLTVAAGRQHDLYYVSGTTATLNVLARERNRPVIFTMVHDPVAEGIIASWDSSENNATGVSNRVPVRNQLKTLKRIVNFRRLGVLYNPTNPDSRQQVQELARLQPFLGFTLVRIPVSAPDQTRNLKFSQADKLDAVYLTRDPLIERLGDGLLERINQAGLPSLAADMTLVTHKGALLGLVPDEYRIGRIAALSAIKILNGQPPAAIPCHSLDFFMFALNMQTAHRLGVQVPFSLLVMADTIVR
jgi:putative tryptophan/tyrosine transport system substrate-binding protein